MDKKRKFLARWKIGESEGISPMDNSPFQIHPFPPSPSLLMSWWPRVIHVAGEGTWWLIGVVLLLTWAPVRNVGSRVREIELEVRRLLVLYASNPGSNPSNPIGYSEPYQGNPIITDSTVCLEHYWVWYKKQKNKHVRTPPFHWGACLHLAAAWPEVAYGARTLECSLAPGWQGRCSKLLSHPWVPMTHYLEYLMSAKLCRKGREGPEIILGSRVCP